MSDDLDDRFKNAYESATPRYEKHLEEQRRSDELAERAKARIEIWEDHGIEQVRLAADRFQSQLSGVGYSARFEATRDQPTQASVRITQAGHSKRLVIVFYLTPIGVSASVQLDGMSAEQGRLIELGEPSELTRDRATDVLLRAIGH